jgi:type VI secretion system protein ImpK
MTSVDFTKTIISQTMDINLTKPGARVETLTTLCTDLFLIAIKMKDVQGLGETASLRKLILYYLTQFEKNCLVIKSNPQIIAASKYALVAMLDETVLSCPGEARDLWLSNPLQLELFGDNIAGEAFYTKLNTLLDKPEENRDALEVYYMCLSLGYLGKYVFGGADERETIITDVARALVKMGSHRNDSLAPHGVRITLQRKAPKKHQSARIPLWIAVSIMATLTLGLWTVLNLSAGSTAQQLAQSLFR